MRPFTDVVFASEGYCVRIALLLLTFLQMYVCVMAFARRRSIAYKAFALIHAAGLVLLFLLMADGTYYPVHLPVRVSFPAAVAFVYRQPWLSYIALELVSFAAAAVCLQSDIRFVKRKPSFESVKEALDDLPVGVCFIAPNGTVALVNLQMNTWCRQLTGQPLSNGNGFLQSIEQAGERRSGQFLLTLREDCVLLFAVTDIAVEGKTYRQLTGTDVTRQFRVTSQLEAQNEKLKDISVRMKAYSVELTDLVMRREMLSARVAVHDGVGHALLRAKYHFEHPEASDASELYALLKRTNTFLLGAAEGGDEAPADRLSQALQLAKGIGVQVTFGAEAPEEPEFRALLAQAVRECAINAVKHAGGTSLSVDIAQTNGSYTVSICSDGERAEKEITLSGGLKSLSDAVAAAGGKMEVRPLPAFTVLLQLPKKTPASRPK